MVTIRFDGRAFSGWQVQRNAPTVMGCFQQALWQVLGERVDIKGCSRTDSGVHALNYCVSFSTESRIPPQAVCRALNTVLPPQISAIACREVPDGFHARYSATAKRYRYLILNSPVRDPFYGGLAWHIPRPVDERVLSDQAADFVGRHDFSAFKNTGTDVEDAVRTILSFEVLRHGELIALCVTGDGFLYNMVRIMVGTLVDIERGRLAKGSIPRIIASLDRANAGITAPAGGLYLERVFYDL